MPRIRSTHPGQWADGDFLECSAFARLLVLALRNMADDNGVFRWKPKSIKATCLPADNCDIDDLLSELIDNEQVTKFDVDGKTYGAIHNFCKYQKSRKPVAVHPLPDTIAAYVGKTTEAGDAKDGTQEAPSTETTGTSSANVRTHPPSSNSHTAEDGPGTELSVQREEGEGIGEVVTLEPTGSNLCPKSAYPDAFEHFWKAYPTNKNMSKKHAFKAWGKLTADQQAQAIAAVPHFAAYCARAPDYPVKHAQGWLNEDRFEQWLSDDPDPTPANAGTRNEQGFDRQGGHARGTASRAGMAQALSVLGELDR